MKKIKVVNEDGTKRDPTLAEAAGLFATTAVAIATAPLWVKPAIGKAIADAVTGKGKK